MRKGLYERRFNTIYAVIVTFLYVAGLFMLFSSKGIAVQGFDYPEGASFSYEGTKYKVFMIPTAEMADNFSKQSVIIPGEKEYRLLVDGEFCEEYNLWTGRCDCDGEFDKLSGQVTFTMNWTGESQQYTFDVFKHGGRDVSEVVHISDKKGNRGYGYATNKLIQKKW